jgi:hypothetical protein
LQPGKVEDILISYIIYDSAEIVSGCQGLTGACRNSIKRLTPLVGDPKTVVDQDGRSLQDRREGAFIMVRYDREQQLRTTVSDPE